MSLGSVNTRLVLILWALLKAYAPCAEDEDEEDDNDDDDVLEEKENEEELDGRAYGKAMGVIPFPEVLLPLYVLNVVPVVMND